MRKQRLYLRGNKSELIIEIKDYAEIIYWGSKITCEVAESEKALSRPVPYGRLDTDI